MTSGDLVGDPADGAEDSGGGDGEIEERQRLDLVSIERLQQFSGPLPHPALFAQYDQVQAGFAERIMRMTEQQLAHQMDLERGELELHRQVASAEIAAFTRAQWFTFVLVVVFLGLAGVGLLAGQALGAAAAGLAALATVAYTLHGRRREDRERDAADSISDEPPEEQPPAA